MQLSNQNELNSNILLFSTLKKKYLNRFTRKAFNKSLSISFRGYVVEKGLDKVVAVAKKYTDDIRNVDQVLPLLS